MIEDLPTTRTEQTAQRQRQALLEYHAILENAWVGIAFSRDRKILRCNPRFSEIFGWPHGELTGQAGSVLYTSAEAYAEIGQIAGPILSLGGVFETETEMRRKDGSTFLAQIHAKAINTADTSAGTIWICEDITKRKNNEASMRRLLLEQRAILENASVGILFTSDGVIMHCNPRMEEMFNWEPGTLAGHRASIFFTSAEDYAGFGAAAQPALTSNQLLDLEWSNIRKDGTSIWCRHLAKSIDLDDGKLSTVWITEDITERKATEEALHRAHDELELRVRERTAELDELNQRLRDEIGERQQAEDRMRHMANHDALTGLPNRRLLNDRLSQAMALAHRGKHKLAVLFIDLDRFKTINDSLGHAGGDLLLQEVAARLAGTLREGDTVARLGGDEFVIVLPDLDTADDAGHVAHKLVEAFAPPFLIKDVEIHATPSIGIAIYPNDGKDIATLTRNADAAMYHAKDMGRNNHQFFSEQMNVMASKRFALESNLHGALERNELLVYYQPQINIETRQLCGFEALLRWQHPEQGLVAPGHFIPLAEETHLIIPIGEWVLHEVCRQNVAWQRAGYPVLPIAVNLSPTQFRQRDLVEIIERALAGSGMAASCLKLEITEGTLMEMTELTLDTLSRLSALGVGLSIDDFGVGYSSLNYLKRFPVDQLKIDQSFVREIATDPDDAAIVTAIIGLAKSLKLGVVAEGIETEQQLAFVAQAGCHEAQGFFFSQPISATDAELRFLKLCS
ncbi:MAG: EAL domain-containing protein [Sulfuritalea sp.]|nr:EAL domain-containing protein [Sulfuritalea sp.]